MQQTDTEEKKKQQDNEEDKLQPQSDADEQQEDTSGQQSSMAEESTETAAAVLTFSPEDGMTWPVSGDVILNYSMDAAVYFRHLSSINTIRRFISVLWRELRSVPVPKAW